MHSLIKWIIIVFLVFSAALAYHKGFLKEDAYKTPEGVALFLEHVIMFLLVLGLIIGLEVYGKHGSDETTSSKMYKGGFRLILVFLVLAVVSYIYYVYKVHAKQPARGRTLEYFDIYKKTISDLKTARDSYVSYMGQRSTLDGYKKMARTVGRYNEVLLSTIDDKVRGILETNFGIQIPFVCNRDDNNVACSMEDMDVHFDGIIRALESLIGSELY